jgi:succinyl-CoA synthetase beta subunit
MALAASSAAPPQGSDVGLLARCRQVVGNSWRKGAIAVRGRPHNSIRVLAIRLRPFGRPFGSKRRTLRRSLSSTGGRAGLDSLSMALPFGGVAFELLRPRSGSLSSTFLSWRDRAPLRDAPRKTNGASDDPRPVTNEPALPSFATRYLYPRGESRFGVRLFEYQAKELLKSYGLPVPNSTLAHSVGEVTDAFGKLSHPVVLKAQVLAGGRGKAGGVVVVSDPAKLVSEAERILRMSISGERPEAILVEEAYPHDEEMYVSITLDRGERCFDAIASRQGGIEIESMAGKVVRPLPLNGIDETFAKNLARELGLDGQKQAQFASVFMTLEKLSREKECELAEINPLAVGRDGAFMPLDAKVTIDDSALFRHPEFSKLHPEDEYEGEASRQGFAFVRLDGDIGVVGNGAGLVLSTLDLVGDAGGKPGCFLDLGGGAQKERVEAALKLVNRLPNISRILINIFGGITRTTDVAEGIQDVLNSGSVKPIFARVSGAEEDEAKRILSKTSVRLFPTAIDAVNSVVASK